jgi:hypothetical protein
VGEGALACDAALAALDTLPDMLIDFQSLEMIAYGDLSGLRRIASIDSPFAQALIARFTQYFGRIGLPDLDFDEIERRLDAAAASSAAAAPATARGQRATKCPQRHSRDP